jgi:hypothetical protein
LIALFKKKTMSLPLEKGLFDATLFQGFFELYTGVVENGNDSCLTSCFFHILEGQTGPVEDVAQKIIDSQQLYLQRYRQRSGRRHSTLMPSPTLRDYARSEVREKRISIGSPLRESYMDSKSEVKLRVGLVFENIRQSSAYQKYVLSPDSQEKMMVLYAESVSHAVTLGWKPGYMTIFDPALNQDVEFKQRGEFEEWLKLIILYRHLKAGKQHAVQFVTFAEAEEAEPKISLDRHWFRRISVSGSSSASPKGDYSGVSFSDRG